ncbi:hypothetical protein SAMN04489712_114134 [Thermomonospora echinospora]|uniref:Uncharacterized protein n=1 Tax=Thermomonospora echinospora TaxID=1992 RepID=A0A1H6D8T3_9ACTN|nr:hypothetical protein SAMN04489712_114134 [Thermomonospora echinospora]
MVTASDKTTGRRYDTSHGAVAEAERAQAMAQDATRAAERYRAEAATAGQEAERLCRSTGLSCGLYRAPNHRCTPGWAATNSRTARAWWMLSLSQITTTAGAAGNAAITCCSRARKSAALRRPSRYAHRPVVTSNAPSTVICRFLPGACDLGRSGDGARAASGSHAPGAAGAGGSRWPPTPPCQAATGAAGRRSPPPPPARAGSPRAISLGRRQMAICRRCRYTVRRLTWGRPRYRHTRGTVRGPGRCSRPAIRAGDSGPPNGGRPLRGRSARAATPRSLNRAIQRRTVPASQSSGTAICAADKPCSDSSTITARTATRHRPRRSRRNWCTWTSERLANPLDGRIPATTSPGGMDVAGNFDPPPGEAGVNALPPRRSHTRLHAEPLDTRLAETWAELRAERLRADGLERDRDQARAEATAQRERAAVAELQALRAGSPPEVSP